jgi:hypothetical protein
MKRRTTTEPTTTLMSTSANAAPMWTALATAFTLVAVTTKTTTANSVGFFVSAADEQQQQQLRGRSSSRNLWGREFNGNGAMQREQQGRGSSGNGFSFIEGNGNHLQYQQHHGFSSLKDFDFDHAREHGDMTYNPGQSTLLIGRPVDLSFVHNSTDGNDIDTNHKLDMNPLAASSSSSGVPQTRIVGGQEDILGPYVMHLQFVDDDPTGKEPFWSFAGCGGTLISNCHVLTAAHCVQRSTRTDGVFIGAYKPFTQDNGGQKRSFSYLASSNVNPGFSNVDNSNDVAILTLETCVTGHEIIDVADNTFMSNNVVQGGLLTVAGFGQLAEADNTPVEALRSVDVGYIPGEQCNSYYPRQVLDDMICAGFPDLGGADSCQGDSGKFFRHGRMCHYVAWNHNMNVKSDVLIRFFFLIFLVFVLGMYCSQVGLSITRILQLGKKLKLE